MSSSVSRFGFGNVYPSTRMVCVAKKYQNGIKDIVLIHLFHLCFDNNSHTRYQYQYFHVQFVTFLNTTAVMYINWQV